MWEPPPADYDYETSMPMFKNAKHNMVVSGASLGALLPMLAFYMWRGYLTIRITQPPLARWVAWLVHAHLCPLTD